MRDAIASGFCAAVAACAGKVAFGEPAEQLAHGAVEMAGLSSAAPLTVPGIASIDMPIIVLWIIRAVFAGLMLSLNGAMISLYVRALSTAGTLVGTVTNTAVNVLASSLLGQVIFWERVGSLWLMGAFITIIGIAFIQKALESDKKTSTYSRSNIAKKQD